MQSRRCFANRSTMLLATKLTLREFSLPSGRQIDVENRRVPPQQRLPDRRNTPSETGRLPRRTIHDRYAVATVRTTEGTPPLHGEFSMRRNATSLSTKSCCEIYSHALAYRRRRLLLPSISMNTWGRGRVRMTASAWNARSGIGTAIGLRDIPVTVQGFRRFCVARRAGTLQHGRRRHDGFESTQ